MESIDVMYSVVSYQSDIEDAVDLIEGEKIYVIGMSTLILNNNMYIMICKLLFIL